MILVVVCHPDDEALWFGGSLYALSQSDNIDVCVICLSGKDQSSPRQSEFNAAKKVAGYSKGIVLGFPLRSAQTNLPNITKTLEEGLRELGRCSSDIQLLITHSPYGDEHRHPHHTQAFQEIYYWTKKNCVSMGFFSIIPLPLGNMRSMLRNYRRHAEVHISFVGRCKYSITDLFDVCFRYGPGWMPKYFIQYQIDQHIKREMMECYKSIGLEQHKNGYAMYTSAIESIYFYDNRGFKLIYNLINQMQVPGAHDLFEKQNRIRILISKVYRRIKNAMYS